MQHGAESGSAGSMKADTFKFQHRFIYTGTNSAARIDYLPLTYYDLNGGKEFVRTYDAVAVAVRSKYFAASPKILTELCP